jgi:hypothetical protein
MLCSIAFGTVQADEPVDKEEVVVPPPRPRAAPAAVKVEEPVSAPAPPFVSFESKSVGVGVGVQWGEGKLQFEGRNHGFSVKGVSVGDIGASHSSSFGEVHNLNDISDFAGNYVAVEAGAAAGPGKSALAMRNAKGVVITVTSDEEGGRLQLGPQGLRIAID